MVALPYWIPERVVSMVNSGRRRDYRWAAYRLAVDEEDFVTVGEFIDGIRAAANFWWWFGFGALCLGALPSMVLLAMIVDDRNAWSIIPLAFIALMMVGISQYQWLVCRAVQARHSGPMDEPLPQRVWPKRRDFWFASLYGVALLAIIIVAS